MRKGGWRCAISQWYSSVDLLGGEWNLLVPLKSTVVIGINKVGMLIAARRTDEQDYVGSLRVRRLTELGGRSKMRALENRRSGCSAKDVCLKKVQQMELERS